MKHIIIAFIILLSGTAATAQFGKISRAYNKVLKGENERASEIIASCNGAKQRNRIQHFKYLYALEYAEYNVNGPAAYLKYEKERADKQRRFKELLQVYIELGKDTQRVKQKGEPTEFFILETIRQLDRKNPDAGVIEVTETKSPVYITTDAMIDTVLRAATKSIDEVMEEHMKKGKNLDDTKAYLDIKYDGLDLLINLEIRYTQKGVTHGLGIYQSKDVDKLTELICASIYHYHKPGMNKPIISVRGTADDNKVGDKPRKLWGDKKSITVKVDKTQYHIVDGQAITNTELAVLRAYYMGSKLEEQCGDYKVDWYKTTNYMEVNGEQDGEQYRMAQITVRIPQYAGHLAKERGYKYDEDKFKTELNYSGPVYQTELK